MTEKRWLALLLVLFVLLGLSYAVVTPVFEASDELWHYPLVRHLADGNPLPVQDSGQVGPWKQQASQPPLYYYVAAALTFVVDASDMVAVRRLNPHVDNGVITADGNTNLVVHDPAWSPWRGTLLAVRLIRIFSVLLGAATVYLTYRIARLVAPSRREIALGAAAVNAFLPMFLFISGAVNNDNLVIPLASLALLLLIQLVVEERPLRRRRLALIGVVSGLAALTKFPALALPPLALGTLFIAHWRRGPGQINPGALLRLLARTLRDWLPVALLFSAVAGWWYWRNRVLYGDWLGWSAFFDVLGVRATPASLAQLWDERWGFMLSFWGLFGGVNVPLPTWIYHVLNGVLIVGVAGFFLYLALLARGRPRRPRDRRPWLARLFDLVADHFALVVCLLWSAAIVASLTRWASITWSSQGRLVFTAISTLTTLLVLGLAGWLPRRAATAVLGALALFLFGVAAATPWLVIRPAYAVQPFRAEALEPRNDLFGDRLRLAGYALRRPDGRPLADAPLRPGEALDVTLSWQVVSEITRDWSVFVHLNDPVLDAPIAQRDMYPYQGLRATSMLRPGEVFVNDYRLVVPTTAVAPSELSLVVGWYDLATGERLASTDGRDHVPIAVLALAPAPGETPNPVTVSFESELLLVGYELAPRRAAAGEELELRLYWQAQRPLDADYTLFAQVVDADTTRWASADIAPPTPTSAWPAGEVRVVTLPMTLRAETPPAVYPIIVGAYTRTVDGGFDRLQRLTPEGHLTDDFFFLTPVRVD